MLSPKQKKLAELMVYNVDLTNEQYAKKINIDPKTVYVWKKKPEFQEYIHELCKDRFKDLEKLAMEKLKEQMINNNWKAIEYVLNGHDYKPSDKIDANVNASVVFEGEDKIED